MGLGEFIKSSVAKINEIMVKEQEEKNANRQKYMEIAKQNKVCFTLLTGANQVGAFGSSTIMRQRDDGAIYFGLNQTRQFEFIEYFWSGPQYSVVTNSSMCGESVKKGKSAKIGAGAIVGGIVGGPAGLLVGGAMGAGSKGVTKTKEDTRTVSTQVEVNTQATLKFRDTESGNIASIIVVCNSLIDNEIRCFNMVAM